VPATPVGDARGFQSMSVLPKSGLRYSSVLTHNQKNCYSSYSPIYFSTRYAHGRRMHSHSDVTLPEIILKKIYYSTPTGVACTATSELPKIGNAADFDLIDLLS
jgi:hypothetical protein